MPSIAMKDVTVDYATGKNTYRALASVSLTVPQGTVCAVIGPSGCGKSTMLKAAAGLLTPTSGMVSVDGAPVSPAQQSIGYLQQNYGLLPWRTVAENIRLACRIKGRSIDEAAYVALCRQLGLSDLLGRYPRELSGGQQQRVSLARVFLLRPDILLMDEPFSALDAITREEMQEVFRALWQASQVTTILVTHYVEEALYLGQQIVLMAPQPGHIAEIIANLLAGQTAARGTAAFQQQALALRQKIRAMRQMPGEVAAHA